MKYLILLALLQLNAFAEPMPPNNTEKTEYTNWLGAIGSAVSPFSDFVFEWYETQKSANLPPEVAQDPEKLFVSVQRPLQETIKLEDAGDIEIGVTYGVETYAILDAPVKTVLEALLFKWGKPVGAREGTTYPSDTVYSYRQESLQERWGSSSYLGTTVKRGGGLAKDQNDLYTLLVRGDETTGYVLIGSFFKPNGSTTTSSSFSITTIKPTADGKTDFRVSGRHMGQNYTFLGVEYGRKNFGFNRDRLRLGQKEFFASVDELKRTGKIRERKP